MFQGRTPTSRLQAGTDSQQAGYTRANVLYGHQGHAGSIVEKKRQESFPKLPSARECFLCFPV